TGVRESPAARSTVAATAVTVAAAAVTVVAAGTTPLPAPRSRVGVTAAHLAGAALPQQSQAPQDRPPRGGRCGEPGPTPAQAPGTVLDHRPPRVRGRTDGVLVPRVRRVSRVPGRHRRPL